MRLGVLVHDALTLTLTPTLALTLGVLVHDALTLTLTLNPSR